MLDEVEDEIHSCGAILTHGPPHSPHLNLIEKHFGKREACLKKNETRMSTDWCSVHMEVTAQNVSATQAFQVQIKSSHAMIIRNFYDQVCAIIMIVCVCYSIVMHLLM